MAGKQCFRCKRFLPESSFYPYRPENRLQSYCKTCNVQVEREYKAAHPEYNKNQHIKFNTNHPGYNKRAAVRARAEARKKKLELKAEAPVQPTEATKNQKFTDKRDYSTSEGFR
jgi:hypothetical protein